MNWSMMLPSDIWHLIGSKLHTAADRVRFRAVSKSFQSYLPFHQPIWLMLSEEKDSEEVTGEDMRLLLEEDYQPQNKPPPRRGFIPVGEPHIHQLNLPEAHLKRCASSTPGGWIVTVDYHGNLCLLNAFTRFQMDLPSQNTLHDKGMLNQGNDGKLTMMHGFLRKLVFSSSEDLINNKDWTAMGIFHFGNWLAICKPGDASWTELGNQFCGFHDIIYFRQQFYLVNMHGAVATYNIHKGEIGFFTKPIHHRSMDVWSKRRFYLVEWMGELLLVERLWEREDIDYSNRYRLQKKKTLGFNVTKRDFTNNEWVELNNLGDYCLFLGLNTSASISIHNYTTGSLRGNCIYFSPNRLHRLDWARSGLPQLGDDIGMYSLEDKSIRFLYHGISGPSCSPPIWIIPTLDQNQ